jgi:predicted AAA+ superfamily ATPase
MMIARPDYIKKLMSWRDDRVIKILTGVRRCGKSTIMEMYQEELLTSGVLPEQIQSYNFEEKENKHLRNDDILYDHIKAQLIPDKWNYVFLDEIQLVPDFGSVANSLYLRGNVDLYITGSNSKTLPIHIANSITREFVTLDMYPLSFREYYEARRKLESPPRDDIIFDEYMLYSSFPVVFKYLENNKFDKPKIDDYLKDLIYKIIYKDITEDRKINEKSRFNAVLKFLADNISKETAIKNIANTMTSNGLKTDHKTIESYIDALCDNFLFYKIDSYDIKGKHILYNNFKYYLADVGLRRALLGKKSEEKGKILENIVFLELLRRGREVYIGKLGNKEIDFVVETFDGLEYYQVAETIVGEETFQREFTPLNSIKDHYPKYILTGDYSRARENGIKIMSAIDWLLDRKR